MKTIKETIYIIFFKNKSDDSVLYVMDSFDGKKLFTKLDETANVGNIFNIKMYTGAQLSYVACGQDVPKDIGKLDVQEIAKQLLGGKGGK